MIEKDGKKLYVGATIGEWSHMWMDGMEEVTAYSWDGEKIVSTKVGYYGCDGQNLCRCSWTVDATKEVLKAVRDYLLPTAEEAYRKAVQDEKNAIRKGRGAVVVRGKKVPIGTKVSVFWVGERETYRSRQYSWMNETEEVAGCYDEEGNKLWIKTEYLKNLTEVPEPPEQERRDWIKGKLTQLFRNYGCVVR